MAKIFSNAVTWIIVLLIAIILLLLGIVFGWWGGEGTSSSPSATPESSSSATPVPSSSGPSDFVTRPVTEGDYVPSADVLTVDVLDSAGSGWVVAIDDTTQIDTSVDPHAVTPDQKILYLISPAGDRYELANLDALGLDAPDLVAWDDARDLVLIEQDRTTLNVFDMATGAVSSSWTFCPGGAGKAMYGEARDENWLVRGGCEDSGIDGLYSDDGTLVPSGIVSGWATHVIDVGDVQVTWEWEGLVDQKFVAVLPDGTSETLPWTDAGDDCYPLAKGRGPTVAMYCYGGAGRLSIWELPVDGAAPTEVVTSAQLEDFAAAEGGYGPDEYRVSGYCSDSVLPIIQFSLGLGEPAYRLGALYGGDVQGIGADASYPFRACHAVSGTSALVSGGGGLWWVDLDIGGSVTLIPPTGSGSPIQTVGTDGYVVGVNGYAALRLP